MTAQEIRAASIKAASGAWALGVYKSAEDVVSLARRFEDYIRDGK